MSDPSLPYDLREAVEDAIEALRRVLVLLDMLDAPDLGPVTWLDQLDEIWRSDNE